MPTQFVSSPDQLQIAYEVYGTGPALMLLHGGGSSHQDWHKGGYIERLNNDFKVIAVDLRGHGESDKPTDPASYTTEKMEQDLLCVADACSVERFILWGYSFGGNVGRYLATRSDRVAKMILVGSPLGAGVSGEWRQLALDFRNRWAPVVQAQLGDQTGGSFDPGLLSGQDQENIRKLSFPGELVPVVLAWSSAMLDWKVVEPANFLCPVLWLFGSENANAMDSYQHYKAGIPGSKVQVHILEGFSHPQEFDEIDRVFPIILPFTRT